LEQNMDETLIALLWGVDLDTLRRICRDLDKRLMDKGLSDPYKLAHAYTQASDIYERRK
jgi:hypothetical protein